MIGPFPPACSSAIGPFPPVCSAVGPFARLEEERGRQSLNRAILLEKEGEKDGWRDATAKKRAVDEYAEAAEVCYFMKEEPLSYSVSACFSMVLLLF